MLHLSPREALQAIFRLSTGYLQAISRHERHSRLSSGYLQAIFRLSLATRGTPGYLGAMGADEGGGGGGPAKVSKSATGGSIARSTYASCGWMVRNRSSQRKCTRLLTSTDRTACQGQGRKVRGER